MPVEDVYKAADSLLYEAKQRGRGLPLSSAAAG